MAQLAWLLQKKGPQYKRELFTIGADGKPTCANIMNDLLDGDRPPKPEIKQMLKDSARKDGFSEDELAYLFD